MSYHRRISDIFTPTQGKRRTEEQDKEIALQIHYILSQAGDLLPTEWARAREACSEYIETGLKVDKQRYKRKVKYVLASRKEEDSEVERVRFSDLPQVDEVGVALLSEREMRYQRHLDNPASLAMSDGNTLRLEEVQLHHSKIEHIIDMTSSEGQGYGEREKRYNKRIRNPSSFAFSGGEEGTSGT